MNENTSYTDVTSIIITRYTLCLTNCFSVSSLYLPCYECMQACAHDICSLNELRERENKRYALIAFVLVTCHYFLPGNNLSCTYVKRLNGNNMHSTPRMEQVQFVYYYCTVQNKKPWQKLL